MSAGTSVRSRAARVATVAASRKRLDERWQRARHRDVWIRIGVCFAAALVMWAVSGGWSRPFPYRSGHIPPRDIVARSAFSLKPGAEAAESFEAGKTIAVGGKPLTPRDLQVLYAEHQAHNANSGWLEKLLYSLARIGVYLALYGLCGSYIYFHDRLLLSDSRRLVRLLGAVVVTVTAAVLVSRDAWRAECIPLVLFGMTLAIVSRRELAFMLSLAVALVIALSLGQRLYELMVLTASVSGPVIMLNRVRSRTKLIYVGLYGAVITFVAVLGVGLVGRSNVRRHACCRPDARWSRGSAGPGERLCHETGFGRRLARSVRHSRRLYYDGLAAVHRTAVRRADRHQPAGIGRRRSSAVAGTGPASPGDVQPFDQRGVAGRGRRRSDRRQRSAGSRRRLFPRHRQDAEAGLLRGKPGP